MDNKCTEIIHVNIDEIKLNPDNPNEHPDDQIERIAEIIKVTGFRRPLTISKNSGLLTVGHGRLLAAKKLGYTELPVIYQDYRDNHEEYNDMVADNAVAEWASLDLDMVKPKAMEFKKVDINYDFKMLGLKDFNFTESYVSGDDEEKDKDKENKFFLEIQFTRQEQMIEVYEDLLKDGHLVKIKS